MKFYEFNFLQSKSYIHLKWLVLYFTFYFLHFTCLYASTCTVYSTAYQFNAGVHDNTLTFGTGDDSGSYVNLLNNFYDITGTPKPDARRWHSTAYSSSEDKVLLFGGFDSSGDPLGDTWVYDPQSGQWTQKSPAVSPGQRYGHIMVSSGTNKVILFGGYNGADYFNDTWEYDFEKSSWTQIVTISSPIALVYSCAGYDSKNNKIILFGGISTGTIESATWIYNFEGSSWTKGAYAPEPRADAYSCYDPDNERFLVFGGHDGTDPLNDTWTYDYNTDTWADRAPGASPSPARSGGGMFYDSKNQSSVLFGGYNVSDNKVWFYSYTANKWSGIQPASVPSAKYGFSVNYISSLQKAFLFGGDSSGVQNNYYNYVFRSSGVYVTKYFDVPYSTELYWLSVEAPNQSGVPANTTLKFQVASSADNISYSEFKGWDNTTGTKYEYVGTPLSIGTTHDNNRYLKLKFYFDTSELPLSGTLQSAIVNFNRSPIKPSLASPVNGFSTSNTTPVFGWYETSDDDNDSLAYSIEIDDSGDFLSQVITSSNIAGISYSTTTILPHGTYFWRVRAWDGSNYSQWASSYTLYIDTIPPAAVTSFSASIGTLNGTINLSWYAPGRDDFSGSIASGKYYVRYSTYSILTENDWDQNSSDEKTITSVAITPGEIQTYTVDGLDNSTTYYFSVKTQDDTGNTSVISATSPFCMTNAEPSVTVKSPDGAETFSGNRVISWEYSDPYPLDDTHTFTIYDSSDGVNFNTTVASGLADGTTSYSWNTKNVINSATHIIKVVAYDARGLEGSDVSNAVFTVNNPNEAPVLTLTQPNGSEKINGNYTISFTVSDANLADNHIFTIYASTNSGVTYDIEIAQNITETSYLWNTASFQNSPKYRIKVTATDNGNPNLSGFDSSESDFEVNNDNEGPSAPVLVLPLNGSYNSIGSLKFVWQESTDPNTEDFLTYTLYYSSSIYFVYQTTVPDITETEYTPTDLIEEVTYYWKVEAIDPFNSKTVSDMFSFLVSWSKDDSDDGKVRVEISQGLPENYYVKIENTNSEFTAASRKSISDRLIKCLNQSVYNITAYDGSGNPQSIPVNASVRFKYIDDNNDGYLDGSDVKADNIRIAYLNETKNKWEFPKAQQINDRTNKQVKVNVEHFSYYTTVASVVPTKKVSNIMNFPNPFNPEIESTTIKYVLTESEDVTFCIFNLVGDLVFKTNIDAGVEGAIGCAEGYTNELTWDGKNGNGIVVANGVYILEVKMDDEKEIRKIAVIK
ncbi:MAG: hypothetical protein JW983_05630 [Elusimicrobia bacterium]|nr:hypothetical protein [Elusimicrobiota bacterium]